MKKCLQYFWPFLWPNVSAMVVFEAVVVVLALVSGVPQGQDGIFATYFYSMPLLILLFLFMYSVSLTTATLNLAIAMGGTRRTYFQGMQLILVVYALIGWGLTLLMPLIPQMGNWVPNQRLHLLLLVSGQYGLLYPLLCLAILVVGGLSGLLMVRSKALGIFVMFLAILVTIIGVVVLGLAGMGFFDLGFTPLFLPIAIIVLLAILILGELLLWRSIRRYVVR